ncbi:MAG: O-antigen ligase family protein [Ideonella sp.]|nr:O-antigen ligase family protein [Ideonella sp.]
MRGGLPLLEAAFWSLLACGAAVVSAMVMVGVSPSKSATMVVAVLCACVFLWLRHYRASLLALAFGLMPMDMSKAVFPPLELYYSPGLYVYAPQAIAMVLLGMAFVRWVMVTKRMPKFEGIDGLVALFLTWIWISAIGSPQGFLAIATAMAYTLIIATYYATVVSVRELRDVRAILFGVCAIVLLQLIWVTLQVVTKQPLGLPGSKATTSAFIVNFGGAGVAIRPGGFTGHPNGLAHHMVMVVPVALSLALLGYRFISARVLAAVWAVLLVASVVLVQTLSRGGWLSAAIAGLVLFGLMTRLGAISGRRLAGAVLLSIGALLLFVAIFPQTILRLTESDDRSVEGRLVLNDQAMAIIKGNPVAGVGLGAYNRSTYAYNGPLYATVSEDFQKQLRSVVVHNGYLLMAAELGIPALILFIVILTRFLATPWPLKRFRDPVMLTLAIGLFASLLGQAIYFSFDNYYVDQRVAMLWMTAGLLRAVTRLASEPASGTAA